VWKASFDCAISRHNSILTKLMEMEKSLSAATVKFREWFKVFLRHLWLLLHTLTHNVWLSVSFCHFFLLNKLKNMFLLLILRAGGRKLLYYSLKLFLCFHYANIQTFLFHLNSPTESFRGNQISHGERENRMYKLES